MTLAQTLNIAAITATTLCTICAARMTLCMWLSDKTQQRREQIQRATLVYIIDQAHAQGRPPLACIPNVIQPPDARGRAFDLTCWLPRHVDRINACERRELLSGARTIQDALPFTVQFARNATFLIAHAESHPTPTRLSAMIALYRASLEIMQRSEHPPAKQ